MYPLTWSALEGNCHSWILTCYSGNASRTNRIILKKGKVKT